MKPENAQLLHALEGEWAEVEWRFHEYRDLFRPEFIPYLNAFAGSFIGLFQRVLWDDLLLGVTRLTDPVGSGKRRNLTFRQVPSFFSGEPEKEEALEEMVQAAITAAEFARDWRNRRIAHRDLSHARDREAMPLEEASLMRLDNALGAIHRIVNTIAGYDRTELRRGPVGPSPSHGLVYTILRLVTAVQFVDELVDPTRASEPRDRERAGAFLDRLEPHPARADRFLAYQQVVELRQVAKQFPRQEIRPRQLARSLFSTLKGET